MIKLPSRQVLAAAPGRVLSFLYGATADPAIWALLATRGYDDREHAHGWSLLQRAGGFGTSPQPRSAAVVAVNQLDAWDEPNFAAFRAALEHHYPEQAEYVFRDLTPSTGPLAVLGVQTFLARVATLESGKATDGSPDRPREMRARDRQAVTLLAARGLTPEARDGLASLVKTAQSLPEAAAIVEDVTADDEDTEPTEHDKALGALHAWWFDWSSSARAVIKKRSQLIRLGLAERRARKGNAEPGGGDPPA